MKHLILSLSCLALQASESVGSPYWSCEIGGVRGDSNPYTDSTHGPLIGIAWTLPITKRQSFRAWSDFSSIQGTRGASLQVTDPTSSPFPWKLIPGSGKWEQNALTLGVDYRIAFFKSETSPYFFIGAIGGRIHATETFVGGSYDIRSTADKVKSGSSWGLGMQFSNKIDLELRFRGFNGFENAGFYSLAAGYHF